MSILKDVSGLELAYIGAVRAVAAEIGDAGPRLKLKLARQMLGLTQREFAERFGLPFTTVRNWESDSRPEPSGPSALFIDLLAVDPRAVCDLAILARRSSVPQDENKDSVKIEAA